MLRRFRNTINQKLYLLILLILLALTVMIAGHHFLMKPMDTQTGDTQNILVYQDALIILTGLESELARYYQFLSVLPDVSQRPSLAEAKAQVEGLGNQINTSLNRLFTLSLETPQGINMVELAQDFETIRVSVEVDLVPLYYGLKPPYFMDSYRGTRLMLARLMSDVKTALEFVQQGLISATNRFEANAVLYDRYIYSVSVVAFFVILFYVLLLGRSITNRLADLIAGVQNVSEGNLSATVAVSSQDELGQLAIFFNIMTRNLRSAQEDIERKTLQLQQANLELERFVSTASHDLKEPLRKIINFSERLIPAQPHTQPIKFSEDVEKIRSAALRMQKLLDELLHYARFMNSAVSDNDVVLQVVAAEALEDLIMLVQESGARVNMDLNGFVLPRAFSFQIRQLFANLLTNAIKFTPEDRKPEINISARAHGPQEFEILVEDRGVGMDPRCLPYIFEPFYRGPNAQDTGGSGIGLAICKRIVDNHHGRITASSHPGSGMQFSIIFPNG